MSKRDMTKLQRHPDQADGPKTTWVDWIVSAILIACGFAVATWAALQVARIWVDQL